MNPKKPSQQNTRILAVETSCDETAAAILVDGRKILSNVVATQIDLHAKFGGVFPEMASRQHILTIYPVVEEALTQANLSLEELDAIAVTRGPGLAGSLVVGMNMAKLCHWKWTAMIASITLKAIFIQPGSKAKWMNRRTLRNFRSSH
jgi:N6-L-threonylcarbamoyladenine synthase